MIPRPTTARYHALAERYAGDRAAHGYAAETVREGGYGAAEFLAWLEGRGCYEVSAATTADLTAYRGYLATRARADRTGALAGGTLASATAHVRFAAARGVLAMLHHAGELAVDPASGLLPERGARESTDERGAPALTQDEVRALYRATASQVERAVLALGYGCGLRVGEAVALDASHVRLHGAECAVTVARGKGGKRRRVPLSEGVRVDLADYYHGERAERVADAGGAGSGTGAAPSAALVLNAHGRRMRGWTYNDVLGRIVARAVASGAVGAEVWSRRTSFHGLRHAIATHLLERGLSLEQVRRFLGHAHVATTEVYTHVSAAMLGELVER